MCRFEPSLWVLTTQPTHHPIQAVNFTMMMVTIVMVRMCREPSMTLSMTMTTNEHWWWSGLRRGGSPWWWWWLSWWEWPCQWPWQWMIIDDDQVWKRADQSEQHRQSPRSSRNNGQTFSLPKQSYFFLFFFHILWSICQHFYNAPTTFSLFSAGAHGVRKFHFEGKHTRTCIGGRFDSEVNIFKIISAVLIFTLTIIKWQKSL